MSPLARARALVAAMPSNRNACDALTKLVDVAALDQAIARQSNGTAERTAARAAELLAQGIGQLDMAIAELQLPEHAWCPQRGQVIEVPQQFSSGTESLRVVAVTDDGVWFDRLPARGLPPDRMKRVAWCHRTRRGRLTLSPTDTTEHPPDGGLAA